MKTKLLSSSRDYFIGAIVMSLGLIYNAFDRDVFGSIAFLISLLIFLCIAIYKYRKTPL